MVRVEIKVYTGMWNPFPHIIKIKFDNLDLEKATDKILEGLNGNMLSITDENGIVKMFDRNSVRRLKMKAIETIEK